MKHDILMFEQYSDIGANKYTKRPHGGTRTNNHLIQHTPPYQLILFPLHVCTGSNHINAFIIFTS